VPGIVLGMEEENALGGNLSEEMITSMKTARWVRRRHWRLAVCRHDDPRSARRSIGISGDSGSVLGRAFIFLRIFASCSADLASLQARIRNGAELRSQILGGGKKEALHTRAGYRGASVAGAITASTGQDTGRLGIPCASLTIDLNAFSKDCSRDFLRLGSHYDVFTHAREKKCRWLMFLLC
jgi:hypothetical protein